MLVVVHSAARAHFAACAERVVAFQISTGLQDHARLLPRILRACQFCDVSPATTAINPVGHLVFPSTFRSCHAASCPHLLQPLICPPLYKKGKEIVTSMCASWTISGV
jgi:hypothetical protein